MAGSSRKATPQPAPPAQPARAPIPPSRHTPPTAFSRAAPVRSMSDVDPFMRVKRPFN